MVNAPIAIPCHFGTWPLIDIDPDKFTPNGVEVRRLEAGGSTEV